jgi:DNA-binding HxlR family transcriptional regulator
MEHQPTGRTGRSYNQYCAVARGLDIIGERWTLLIIRDLLVGPKRYKDLLDGLSGIGTNLLAARLRELEKEGIVRRTVLPPPAASTVYELTETGQALEPAIGAIGRWGARFLGSPRETDMFPIDGYMVAMRISFKAGEAAGIDQTYELRVGGRIFEIRVAHGECTITQGQARDPDAVLKMDIFALHRLLKEGVAPREALANGEVTVSGDEKALSRFVKMFALDASGRGVVHKATRGLVDPSRRR